MPESQPIKPPPDGLSGFSYLFMLGVFVLVIALRLATPVLAVLFTYLALTRMQFARRGGKWLSVAIVFFLLAAISYSLGYVINQTVRSLPEIADQAIPSILQWTKKHGLELPFTDYDSLKDLLFDTVKSEVHYLGSIARFARGAGTQLVLLIAGCFIAFSLFLNPRFELGAEASRLEENLYARACAQIAQRFRTLYRSFVTVMGAQIIISAINTLLTAIFVLAAHLPYRVVIIGMTFLCGLLPVVGNLISNTIVVGIGFTVSPQRALIALIFLVVIHKLEYLLNSKIVGWRIHNPLWLTLLALIIGERLLGLPGMILAPVLLNYIKLEASGIRVGA
jgi:predicted PurR-regulated permease PerM